MLFLKEHFEKKIKELYQVDKNMARVLFEDWQIERFDRTPQVDEFLSRDDVRRVFYPTELNINIIKHYKQEELLELGLELKIVDAEKHIFKDQKLGWTWQELFHGHGDCYTGLFYVTSPGLQDTHLREENRP